MASNEEEKVELHLEVQTDKVQRDETDGKLESADIEENYFEANEGEQQGKETEFVDTPLSTRLWEVFTTFWPLGFVAFGGPQAHVAILRDHLVVQRDWMDEDQFTELFAIGQGLPGPTSTQLVISTALSRAGPLGGLLAFFLWNLPGLIVLTTAGVLIASFLDPNDPPFYLIGIAPAAISLVFKAFYGFTKKLDKLGIILSLISACVAILINGDENIQPTSSQYVFPSMLIAGSLVSLIDSKRSNPFGVYANPSKGWEAKDDILMKRIGIPLWVGGLIFVVWAGILVLVVFLKDVVGIQNKYLDIFETMYRIGSLIFGGGQVVLPMLQSEVSPSWMSTDNFFQGLGLAQSLPGPLFNFSSYLGAVYAGENEKISLFLYLSLLTLIKSKIGSIIIIIATGIPGALVAYIGLFGPGVILIFGMVPFWARLRHLFWFKVILHGLNATAIGLVGAACVILWEAAIRNSADAIVFCVGGTLAVYFNVPAPAVVLVGCILGAILCEDAASLGQVEF
jgi:chromate transporter